MDRQQIFITEARRNAVGLWNAIYALQKQQAEWNALDYGNTLADGTDENEGYTADEIGAVVFATTDALLAVLAAGSATNIAKLL